MAIIFCRINAHLESVVQNLTNFHKARLKKEEENYNLRNKIIQSQFPWAIHNNTIPNHFIHSQSVMASIQNGTANLPHIVLLHQHRAAGSAMKLCLDEIATKHSLSTSPLFRSDTRFLWDMKKKKESPIQNRIQVHSGQYSFGLCNDASEPCSYMTILRDPMESTISSYYYCKTALSDEMCKVSNANTISLRDWILHHGSLLFRQILFQSHWCYLVDRLNDTIISDKNPDILLEANRVPCWYKHKISFNQLNPLDTGHLLEYILDNFDKWFNVIGLFDDIHTSIQMFERVYQLPFSQCSSFQDLDWDSYVLHNEANNKKHKVETYNDNDPEYLKYDYEVKEVMDADMRIYKKAKQLYKIQKQVLFNKL